MTALYDKDRAEAQAMAEVLGAERAEGEGDRG